MALKFYNTLTREKEVFVPIDPPHVGFYSCGPTVYNYAHIGNLRAYVFADILQKTLENEGYKVKRVMNITDIGHLSSDADDGEDKMAKGLKREGKPFTLESMKELAVFYKDRFMEDLAAMNIKTPDIIPFASDHIKEDVEIIEKLLEKGFAYKTSDGIYFEIAKFPDYWNLSGKKENAEEFLTFIRNIKACTDRKELKNLIEENRNLIAKYSPLMHEHTANLTNMDFGEIKEQCQLILIPAN